MGALMTGVDYAWGRPGTSALRSGGYRFACRYVSPDTTGKNLTQNEAQRLIGAGISIVLVWEWNANAALAGYTQGVSDAQRAASQAAQCGMPADRPIYFAVDFDATPGQQPAINSYFDGVAFVLGLGRTGAYGGYYPIRRLFDARKITYGWQTYAWSDGQWDSRAQLRQVRNGVTIGGADCDIDEAWAVDYGQWATASGSGGSTVTDVVVHGPDPYDSGADQAAYLRDLYYATVRSTPVPRQGDSSIASRVARIETAINDLVTKVDVLSAPTLSDAQVATLGNTLAAAVTEALKGATPITQDTIEAGVRAAFRTAFPSA